MHRAGAAKLGTNEDLFIDVFSSHSAEELAIVADTYDKMFNHSLDSAIRSEFSGSIRDALISLLYSPLDLACRQLKSSSVDTIGTDEKAICRIIGGNDKGTVQAIALRYFEKYDSKLADDLEGELSGDFREAVLTYIRSSDVTGGTEELIKQARRNQAEQAAAAKKAADAATAQASQTSPGASTGAAPAAALTTSHPATNGVPDVMKGWGKKEGHFFKNWKRRFFVLTSDVARTELRFT